MVFNVDFGGVISGGLLFIRAATRRSLIQVVLLALLLSVRVRSQAELPVFVIEWPFRCQIERMWPLKSAVMDSSSRICAEIDLS